MLSKLVFHFLRLFCTLSLLAMLTTTVVFLVSSARSSDCRWRAVFDWRAARLGYVAGDWEIAPLTNNLIQWLPGYVYVNWGERPRRTVVRSFFSVAVSLFMAMVMLSRCEAMFGGY
jgi:hypothetical protein